MNAKLESVANNRKKNMIGTQSTNSIVTEPDVSFVKCFIDSSNPLIEDRNLRFFLYDITLTFLLLHRLGQNQAALRQNYVALRRFVRERADCPEIY